MRWDLRLESGDWRVEIRVQRSEIRDHITLPYIIPRHFSCICITLYYITLHYITFHYIVLHYITLPYIREIRSDQIRAEQSRSDQIRSYPIRLDQIGCDVVVVGGMVWCCYGGVALLVMVLWCGGVMV